MSFNAGNLAKWSAQNVSGPNLYGYITTDTVSQVSNASYFTPFADSLDQSQYPSPIQIGDNIQCDCSDGSIIVIVTAIDPIQTTPETVSVIISPNSVYTAAIQDGAVTTAKIADGAVDTTEIADGAVTAAKIADGAVVTAAIGDGAVTGPKIAANAVTSSKIGPSQVTTAKLATGAVTTTAILDGNVTNAKIANGAVTGAKIAANTIAAGNIINNTITATQIANATLTSTQLASNTITSAQVAKSLLQNTSVLVPAANLDLIFDVPYLLITHTNPTSVIFIIDICMYVNFNTTFAPMGSFFIQYGNAVEAGGEYACFFDNGTMSGLTQSTLYFQPGQIGAGVQPTFAPSAVLMGQDMYLTCDTADGTGDSDVTFFIQYIEIDL